MKNKWVEICGEKKEKVKRVAQELPDEERALLKNFETNNDLESNDKKIVDQLKKRKLVNVVSAKSYKVTKGVNFAP